MHCRLKTRHETSCFWNQESLSFCFGFEISLREGEKDPSELFENYEPEKACRIGSFGKQSIPGWKETQSRTVSISGILQWPQWSLQLRNFDQVHGILSACIWDSNSLRACISPQTSGRKEKTAAILGICNAWIYPCLNLEVLPSHSHRSWKKELLGLKSMERENFIFYSSHSSSSGILTVNVVVVCEQCSVSGLHMENKLPRLIWETDKGL